MMRMSRLIAKRTKVAGLWAQEEGQIREEITILLMFARLESS